jgi:hypothetical protein
MECSCKLWPTPGKVFAGTLTSAGSLGKQVQQHLAGVLSSAGDLANSFIAGAHGVLYTLDVAGTLTTAGSLVKQTAQHLAGTLTSAGSLTRQAGTTLLGTLTPASDVFGAASGAVITAAAITQDSAADNSGTPGWVRVYRTGDTAPGSSAATSDRRLDMAAGPGTLLNGAINNAVTTITVDSTAGFGNTGELLIDSERITYTGRTGTTFTGCTRGANGSSAASHADNAAVSVYGTEVIFDNTNFVSDGFVAGGAVTMSAWTITQPRT